MSKAPRNHETIDAAPRVAWIGLGVMAAALMTTLGLVALLLASFDHRHPHVAVVQSPPPAPRLEVSPGTDLVNTRRRAAALTTTYGWTNRQAGLARIPVDRAMAMRARLGWADTEDAR
jgi:hypothetical protein